MDTCDILGMETESLRAYAMAQSALWVDTWLEENGEDIQMYWMTEAHRAGIVFG